MARPEIEDITAVEKKKKKKADSGRKGKRGEHFAVKILSERFGMPFSRSIGSGNRTSQVSLSAQANQVYSGDIVVPENFLFVLESKFGYDQVDLASLTGSSLFEGFLKQVSKDSDKCGRKPMLLWKKTRRPYIAFVKKEHLPERSFDKYLAYDGWIGVPLEELLKEPDEYFLS